MRLYVGCAAIALIALFQCTSWLRPHDRDVVRLPKLSELTAYTLAKEQQIPYRVDISSLTDFAEKRIPFRGGMPTKMSWLAAPAGCGLPPIALALSNFGTASGFLCLMTAEGRPVASTELCGMVQSIYAGRIAPIDNPQILVLANTSRGTGSAGGELLLFELDGEALTEIMRVPRYFERDIAGETEVDFAMPLFLSEGSVVVVPVISRKVSPEPAVIRNITFNRLEWDRNLRRYNTVHDPGVDAVAVPDLWEWTGDEYRAPE